MGIYMDSIQEETWQKWMDNIREDCAEIDMSLMQASRLAWDRAQWRNTIRNKGCHCTKMTSSSSPGHYVKVSQVFELLVNFGSH